MQRPALRWTVGPHAPSVYWRRRALVAVGVAVLILLGWLTLRPSQGRTPTAQGSVPAATGQPAVAQPGGSTGASDGPPANLASPGFQPATPEPSATQTGERPAPPPSVAPCTDDQIAVTVGASPSPGLVGATFTFSIAITNRSDGWCARDLGSGAQEIRVLKDGALLFSSDDCGSAHGSDVRAFAAGDAVRYRYTWSSYRTKPHDCGPAATPAPPGTYQVTARVGTKVSSAVDFTITK